MCLWACSPRPWDNNGGTQVTDVKLDPPGPGQGFQLSTGAFEVPVGDELQDCYFFQVPGAAPDPVYVTKLDVAQNNGSHHMNVFRVKTIVRDTDGSARLGPENGAVSRGRNGTGECFKSPNWADWPLVINSQAGGALSWELPAGVAHRFEPGEWLMVQTHYVNATTQRTDFRGLVLVNFWTAPASAVQHELGTLFATKQSIRICQGNPTPSFDGTCQFNNPEPVHVVAANGHFHSRGTEFFMYAWDGMSTQPAPPDRFYYSDVWDDPPMLRSPELDATVPAHGGVFYTCAYEWMEPAPSIGCSGLNALDAAPHPSSPTGTPPEDLDCCYVFGGLVETGEHCNIFVYYWPKVDNINCF
ncbi:MAG: hypothetical protein HY904_25835 [Deltaproteobacteria bacterium]|nr:hypothetical protein [Deltaproteobacteria bacterium]